MKLSVIVPTIGRPTLSRALKSIEPRLEDEVIVVSTNHDARAVARSHGCKYLDYPYGDSVAGGAQERSYGIRQATGDYLVFLDDDDVMADAGLETIREELAKPPVPTPFLFRVSIPGGKIWSEDPSLALGEVTGSQFVCPRTPVATWPREQSGDHPFINSTINLWGRVRFVDKVIIDVRPEQQ